MKPTNQEHIDDLINAAITFGLAIPSSVNNELRDNGYQILPDTVILKRVAEILAAQVMEDNGDKT